MGIKAVVWLTDKLKECHRHGEDMTLRTQNTLYFWFTDRLYSLNWWIVLFFISNLQVASLPTLQIQLVCWAWRRDHWSSSLWKNLKSSLTLSKTLFLSLQFIFLFIYFLWQCLVLNQFTLKLWVIFFTSKWNLITNHNENQHPTVIKNYFYF